MKCINNHDYRSKPCKYFDEGRGECPFAGACFYKHAYPDGRIAKFNKPKSSRRYQSRNFSLAAARLIVWNIISRPNRDEEQDDDDDDEIVEIDEDDEEDEDFDVDDLIDVITDDDVDTDGEAVLNETNDDNGIEEIIGDHEVILDDEEDDEDELDHHLDINEFEMPTFEDYESEDFDYTPMQFHYRLP